MGGMWGWGRGGLDGVGCRRCKDGRGDVGISMLVILGVGEMGVSLFEKKQ